jgi:hypothetical protein
MNDRKASSILQRLPLVLAVTAASYGLPLQAHAMRAGNSLNTLCHNTSTSHGAATQAQPRLSKG